MKKIMMRIALSPTIPLVIISELMNFITHFIVYVVNNRNMEKPRVKLDLTIRDIIDRIKVIYTIE